MLAKVMTIKGSLRLSETSEGIEGLSTIRVSFANVSQCKLSQDIRFTKTTVFELDSSVKIGEDGRKAAARFINNLHTFVVGQAKVGSDLQGSVLLTLETGEDPVTIRVTVKEGKVTHQEARLVWDAEEVISND